MLPANDADAPGYEAEKNLGRAGKDAARLAYLESEQAHRALSAEEQQELGALLAKVKGTRVQRVEELEITIPPEDKIDRNLLNPPDKPGNAPSFKKDGSKVEIHHIGQQRDGPFVELHKEDHRGKGNDKLNHPHKHLPSQVDRREFDRAKKKYWRKEFSKNSNSN